MSGTLWLLLGGGAALGGVLRYLLSEAIGARGGFPLGTLVVNVSGAFGIGMLAGAMEIIGGGTVWPVFLIAVLGSYTTVSSFSLQTLMLARDGRLLMALGNVLLSFTLCLGAAVLGHQLLGAPS